MYNIGEFDPESMNPYNAIDKSEIQSQSHRDLAIKAAQMTFTLLKNDDGILPIKTKTSKIAVNFFDGWVFVTCNWIDYLLNICRHTAQSNYNLFSK